MKFSKNKKLYITVIILLLILFNLISFLLPFPKSITFWLGYSFISLSIVISATVLYFIFDKKQLKSRFYGVPLIYVLAGYVSAQVVIGIVEMATPKFKFEYALIINIVILILSIIGLISLTVATNEIDRIDDKVKNKIFYIQNILVLLENLMDEVANEDVLEKLESLKDLIKYSDSISNDNVELLESRILENITKLSSAKVENMPIEIDKIIRQVKERNRLIKIHK